MVGARQVLLSIAVLSGLGFDGVLGGSRLRRQDGAANTVESASDAVSSLSTATVATAATASAVSSGSSSGGEGTSPGRGPQAAGGSDGSGAYTVHVDAAPAASTGTEYVDPGVFGAGGTLTTDTRAPTRSVEPSKSSVTPGSQTTRGPPPLDTRPPLTRTPPARPPGRPAVDGGSVSTSVDLASATSSIGTTAATDTSTAAAAAPTTPATTEPATAAQASSTPLRGGPPGGPPRLSTTEITRGTTETVDLGYGGTTFQTSIRPANETFTYVPSVTVSYCQASDLATPVTSWSVVHTTTITWYGDPDDYTQPYPPISVPQPTPSCIVPVDPPRLTISVCASTGTDSKYKTCEVTTTAQSWNFGVQTSTAASIVFLTTDKNPAVVFSSIRTPNYGVSQEPKTRDTHATPTAAGGTISTPVYNSDDGPQAITQPAQRPTPTPVTVGVQPTGVVINGNTIRDNPAQPTQVVIIADQTFTIDPTRVVGGGATIDRPSATGGVYLPTPTSTNLGGVPVVVSSTVAVIGGSSFTLPPGTPTTATVSGQTFTLGPSTIAGASQTVILPTLPSPTEVVVAGGDLITAIGQSVIVVHGTTLTYSTSTTLQVDDDTITLGPGGITAHSGSVSVTIGGSHASSPQETQFALVGGATVTKVGASVVVISGVSYTLGPGTGTTTTVVGGESVTVAPGGVTVGTMTYAYPFGPTTVITPGAGVGTAVGGAKATSTVSAGGNGGEEDAAFAGARPWIFGVVWGVGVAVGVGVMV